MTTPTPADELRELIREAHGLLKDLRVERRAITALLDGIPARVDARIKEQLKTGLADLSEATRTAMETSVARVGREFDRLAAILTGLDPAAHRARKPTLEELIRARKGPGR